MSKLDAFIKGSTDPEKQIPGCANYDHYHDTCMTDEPCLVMEGKRCSYFEKAVLPTDGQAIHFAYEKLTGAMVNVTSVNTCNDCPKVIPPRRRYCDSCKKKRQRKTQREQQRAYQRQKRACA